MKTTLALIFALPALAFAEPPLTAPSSLGSSAYGSMRQAAPVMQTPNAAQSYTGVPRIKIADTPQPPPVAQPELELAAADKQKIPVQMLPVERQLERLHRQVEELQRRLAEAEKRFAEHRHEYNTTNINQINYRTVKMLLDNSDRRDGLLHFSSNPVKRDTSPPMPSQ